MPFSEYNEKILKINHLIDSNINKKQPISDEKAQNEKYNNIEIIYAKSKFSTKEDLQMFANILTTYCRQTISGLNELPINKKFEDQFYK